MTTLSEIRIPDNPADPHEVAVIKTEFRSIMDRLEGIQSDDPEFKRLRAIAHTTIQDASMWSSSAVMRSIRSNSGART